MNILVPLLRFLSKRSTAFSISVAIGFMLLIGFLEYITTDFYLIVFYLIPISLLIWVTRLRVGLIISFISALMWIGDDILESPMHVIRLYHIWNVVISFSFLSTYSYVLSELKNALEEERRLSRTDPLTDAYNDRAFCEISNMELDRARRYNHPITMVYFDLDNFKSVNDRFGHSVGNRLLVELVKTIKANIRTSDVVARLGGDEFAIMLPEISPEDVQVNLARLHKTLQELMVKNNWPVTFSVGVVTYLTPPSLIDEMIRTVDDLMYSVKNDQKNMIKYQVVN